MGIIYIRHLVYLENLFRKQKISELKQDSKPGKNDQVFFTDVGAFRTWQGIKQVYRFWKQNIPMTLFLFEPPVVMPYNYWRICHLPFKRVFTWRDSLVGGKYKKIHWPQSDAHRDSTNIPFKKKKFLAIMNANKRPALPFYPKSLYRARIQAMRYFDKKIDIYGRGWDQPTSFMERFTGVKKLANIQGWVKDKHKALQQYKFNICYENMQGVPGYITEKIWDAFKARSVPVYWGAPNITEYIPEGTFIDRRKFSSNRELELFLEHMTEDEYNKYIESIEAFVQSKKSDVWFEDAFLQQVLEQ